MRIQPTRTQEFILEYSFEDSNEYYTYYFV